MAAILGSDIDKLVLGYLQDKNLKKASEAFCKTSPHLQEEYELLKRGLKPCRILDIKLIEVLKEYTEIRAIVTDFIDAKQNVSSSSELLNLRTLPEKVRYLCSPAQQPPKETKNRRKLPVKRRRPSSEAGSDEDESSSPQATQIEDLPGYSQSTAFKRRKLFDKNLIITNGPDVDPQSPSFTSEGEMATTGETSKSNQINTDTTRPSTSHAMSTKKRDIDACTTIRPSTSFKQSSAMTADPTVPFEIFSETILENQEFQNLLVENINTSGIVDRVQSNDGNNGSLERQLEQAMENIIINTESNPIFEDIVREAVENQFWPVDDGQLSSSTPNKSSEHETVNDEVINAQPVAAQSESIKLRLRPRKVPTTEITASTTKKKKADKKIEVLSEVRTYPNQQLQAMIQTQENQFQSQQQQPYLYYYHVDSTGTPYLMPVEYDQTQSMAANSDYNFPILLDGTVCIPSIISSSTTTTLDPGTILNTTDPQNAVVVHDNSQQNLPNEEPSSSCLEENRIIIVDGDEVNAEAEKIPKSQSQINPISTLLGFTATTEHAPKANTPKQPIQLNIPCSSKSLTTPRHKISHVRVLDFTTPARSKLVDPNMATYTGGLDVLNSSRMAANETPQNRTIISTVPNSAPPKIDSTKTEQVAPPILHAETSSSMDTVIHVDVGEDTVISVGTETPKVRKRHRKACVRTLSSHKEVNTEDAAKRLKRLEKTKKKIDPNDDSNGSGESSQVNAFNAISAEETKEGETNASTDDNALREWQQTFAARKNPALFEQRLRESNSKSQAEKDSANAGKRRTNRKARTKKKTAANTSTINQNETAAPNVSLNSSVESGCNESNASLQAHAQMLENNLKSAKKVSPERKVVATKTRPKRNKKEIFIKLPESPKVKALKRQKSSAKLKASTSEVSSTTEQHTEISQPAQEEALPAPPPPPPTPKLHTKKPITRVNTSDDLEVAQNLLQLNETIIQSEKQLSARKVTATQSDCTSTVTTATTSDTIVPVVTAEFSQRSAIMSLSALLETPMKADALAMFPKTPGIMQLPPQLVTPMLKATTNNPMEDSIMKNPEFPTPNFPITPGAILTPCRDVATSPRSDQETVYGAVNRPTDYSSSSSYYKPDESDGVDKQLQALLRASRKNSSAQSPDEMNDESAEVPAAPNEPSLINVSEEHSHERLNYSGSSSSSSSSSSSDDSDSDSSDSSSNSSDSNLTRKSLKIDEPIETVLINVQETSEEMIPLPDPDLVVAIKSHIESTASAAVTKSILLAEPEPVIDKVAEQMALLAEKRSRMQRLCRQDNLTKNTLKSLPKSSTAKRVRVLAEARHETFRGPQMVLSPSKRKLTQPRKCFNRAVISKESNSQCKADNDAVKATTSKEIKHKSIESSGTNETRANLTDQPSEANRVLNSRSGDEESIDAIQNHLANDTNRMKNITKELLPALPVVPSQENLIEILEDKANVLAKRSPSIKTTKQIEPLPLRKIGVRNTKTRYEATTATSINTKSKPKSRSRSKTTDATVEMPALPQSSASKTVKASDSHEKSSSKELNSRIETASPVSETPIKERRAEQLYSIFGEISDIETPVKKSPVKTNSFVEPNSIPVAHSKDVQIAEREWPSQPPPQPPPQLPPQSPPQLPPLPPTPEKELSPSKENHVTSTTSSDQSESKMENTLKSNDSNETNNSDDRESRSDDDDDESDDESLILEKCDQSHIEHIFSNDPVSSKITSAPHHTFRQITLVLSDRKVALKVTDEAELYRSDPIDEPSSSTFEKPLQTSTPTVKKSKPTGICPKFNLKHKDHKPTSILNDGNAATTINRKDLNVNKILGYLHPEDTKSKH